MSSAESNMRVVSVQLGQARPLLASGRRVLSGIVKVAVAEPVPVLPLGLLGDEQVDLSVHGGLDKAVYAYPVEHYAFWQARRQQQGVAGAEQPLPWGAMGENLSVAGLDEQQLYIGDELHLPDCVLRVTAPRQPCYKFDARMGYPTASRDMVLSHHCGFYLSVEQPGSVAAGQGIRLVPGSRSLSVAQALAARRFKHLR